MTDGTMAMVEAIARESVASAVRERVIRSSEARRLVEEDALAATKAEVERLRSVVAAQAQQIADLESRVSTLLQHTNELQLRELVESVSDSVFSAGTTFEGYAIKDASVDIRTALTFEGGAISVTADPGSLLSPSALSSVQFRLAALPPRAGEQSRDEAIDRVRLQALAVQAMSADAVLNDPARQVLLTAATRLAEAPGNTDASSRMSDALERVGTAEPRLHSVALAAASDARRAADDPSARNFDALATSLGRVADQLSGQRG